jgi:hypothetical protein
MPAFDANGGMLASQRNDDRVRWYNLHATIKVHFRSTLRRNLNFTFRTEFPVPAVQQVADGFQRFLGRTIPVCCLAWKVEMAVCWIGNVHFKKRQVATSVVDDTLGEILGNL